MGDRHRDAIADTGTSHVLLGRGYGVRCEWCPRVFFGASQAEAMKAFRVHERDVLSARGGHTGDLALRSDAEYDGWGSER